MKNVAVVFAVGLALVVASAADAREVFRINFDIDPLQVPHAGPAPDPYPGGTGDILAGSTNELSPIGGYDDNNVIVASDGPQGGGMYQQVRGAHWANSQGYEFNNLPGTPAFNGNGPDYFVANDWTLEVLVKPDFTNTGFGIWNTSWIFGSRNLADGSTWGDVDLWVDQNNGLVSFYPSSSGIGGIVANTPVVEGQWNHIAAVVRSALTGGPQQVELYINGVLQDTLGAYPGGWETQDLFRIPGGTNTDQIGTGDGDLGIFTIGADHWPTAGNNYQGDIDALVISDMPLGPGSFAIPEPATLVVLALGGIALVRRNRK